MKKILFAALLLGSFLAVIAQHRGTFEFTDSNGQCWRCEPGLPCERCPVQRIPNPRVVSDECLVPDCNAAGVDRSELFPSPVLRQYFQCEWNDATGTWTTVTHECPCNTLFSYATQRCEMAWEFVPHCRFDVVTDPAPVDCDQTATTTTTVDPGDTTTTTVAGDTTTTTPRPCVCVIWWPCMCNPCMGMPRPPSCMMMG